MIFLRVLPKILLRGPGSLNRLNPWLLRHWCEYFVIFPNHNVAIFPHWTTSKFDKIPVSLQRHFRRVSSAVCNSLHWLNFPQRVTYKLCMLTYKCLHGLAPDYLTRLSVCALQRSVVVLGCDHQMTINCSSHGHVQLLLVCAPSTPPNQHPGTLCPLRFVIRQSHWEPLGRC